MVDYIIRTDKPERLNELLKLHEIPHYTVMELRPHGRLIDADELVEYYSNLDADNGEYVETASETADTIESAPTVLEATDGITD